MQGQTHKTMSHLSAELHRPVMLQRCLELLRPALQGDTPVVVDATLGLGGHSEALLTENPTLRVIGLDRDPQALKLASERLAGFGDRFEAVEAIYDEIEEVLQERKIAAIQGALFDLGVSSMQLDVAERGFAYAQDAPLDMRMDQTRGETAADLLANLELEELESPSEHRTRFRWDRIRKSSTSFWLSKKCAKIVSFRVSDFSLSSMCLSNIYLMSVR